MKTDPFTEGTDCSAKGFSLFQKRRQTIMPFNSYKTEIIDNPSSVDLINALK
jgi:hypothetical protein